MSKYIINRNSKGELHGYNEWCWGGKLCYKGSFNNGKPIDYWEYYYLSGELRKIFNI